MGMEAKSNVEEKRVKSTIIRRRAKVDEVPAAPVISTDLEASVTTAISAAPKVMTVAAVEGSSVEAKPPVPKGAEPASGLPAALPTEVKAPGAEEAKPKKAARKLSREELEMEMIERAGGIKRVAMIADMIPERLERVFRPPKPTKKKRMMSRRDVTRGGKKTEITVPKAIKKIVRIEGTIVVSDLAHRMGIKMAQVIRKLMDLGVMATANERIDLDTTTLIAQEFGFEVENVAFTEHSVLKEEVSNQEDMVPRPPVVTVMGHVDHGKTSLLDMIRKAKVAAGEAGGITQHIGGYKVQLPKGTITFVDTPGHEAFTAMRARGAQVTDLVILVVAADDGVMPQTIEAINHAKAAKVPIIVAINKIDKPNASTDRVERELMTHGLVSEKLGGDTMFAPVSAKTGQGLEELLEMILLQAEILDLHVNIKKRARGTIIEAKLDKGRGPVATLIVQEGIIRLGQSIVAGQAYGKVKALVDDQGRSVKEAGPSDPVEVLGLSKIPMASDILYVASSDDDARVLAEHREQKERLEKSAKPVRASLEDVLQGKEEGKISELRLIMKGDVQGSIEALRESLQKLSTDQVKVSVLHTGVGAITESDVILAVASKAVVVGFNVRPDNQARQQADTQGIQIKTYSIIYELLDEVKKAMEGLLKPTFEERYLGRVEIRKIFVVSKVGTIAGCFVSDGKINRQAQIRILRDGVIVHQGKLASLKRFKDDVRDVANNMECGLSIENFNDIKVGDMVEAFIIESVAGRL